MIQEIEALPPFTSKYGYNGYEMLAMTIATALTNLNGVPGTLINYRCGSPHRTYVGALVTFTSFMYHFCESIGTDVLLSEGQWHRLDNVAAISAMNGLMIYMMNLEPAWHSFGQWLTFIIVMVLQEGYPWEIEYTIWPIAIGAVVMTIKLIFCRDNGYWNREALSKGLISLAFAVYCFSQGLDEYKDYLRIYHGFWHVFVTIACFYLFQAHERETIQNWEFMKLLCYTNVKN